MCGNCCRNMRGRTGEKLPPSLPPYIHVAVPRSEKTIELFEWEVSTLKTKAKQFSLDFKVKPDTMFWDDISETPIVTGWNLDHDDCPFLSNKNLCIVNQQKPLICQAYPLMAFGLLRTDVGEPKEIGLADCPHAVSLPFKEGERIMVKPSVVFRKLFRSYGSTFMGMLRLDFASLFLSQSLIELTKNWLIYPAIIDKTVKKLILSKEPIGLMEHLRNKHSDKERTLQESIRSIYDVDDVFIQRLVSGAQRRT